MAISETDRTETPWLTECVEQFRCTGPECAETCCAGWKITVDAAALVSLRRLNDAAVNATLAANLLTPPEGGTPMQAGVLRLQDNGDCAFLRRDHLCHIQANFGEEPMPLGCRIYPRVQHRIDGQMIRAMSLSCPEAAHRMLCVEASENDRENGGSTEAAFANVLQTLPATGDLISLFWPLQRTHQAILGDRRLPIAKRMQRMGRLAQTIDAAKDGNAAQALREFCAESQFHSNPARVDSDTISTPTLEFLLAATDAAVRFARGNVRFRALTARVLRGLEYAPDTELPRMLTRVSTLRDDFLNPFLARHPQFMERFLWNEIIRTTYPVGVVQDGEPTKRMTLAFLRLTLEWTWIRLYMIGLAGDDALNLESAADCVQSLARAVFARQVEFDALGAAMERLLRVLPLEELLSL